MNLLLVSYNNIPLSVAFHRKWADDHIKELHKNFPLVYNQIDLFKVEPVALLETIEEAIRYNETTP